MQLKSQSSEQSMINQLEQDQIAMLKLEQELAQKGITMQKYIDRKDLEKYTNTDFKNDTMFLDQIKQEIGKHLNLFGERQLYSKEFI